MSSFDWEKIIEDSIKDETNKQQTGIFFALKAANAKPPKASLNAMDIMKLARGICGGVLVKDYGVYKKMDQRVKDCLAAQKYKNFIALRGHKTAIYLRMVRMLLGSLTAKWATGSSRLNT